MRGHLPPQCRLHDTTEDAPAADDDRRGRHPPGEAVEHVVEDTEPLPDRGDDDDQGDEAEDAPGEPLARLLDRAGRAGHGPCLAGPWRFRGNGIAGLDDCLFKVLTGGNGGIETDGGALGGQEHGDILDAGHRA